MRNQIGWNQVNDAIFDLYFQYRTIPTDCSDGEPPFMLDTDVCCDVDNGSNWWSNLTIPWLTTTRPMICYPTSFSPSPTPPPVGRALEGRATAPPLSCTYS